MITLNGWAPYPNTEGIYMSQNISISSTKQNRVIRYASDGICVCIYMALICIVGTRMCCHIIVFPCCCATANVVLELCDYQGCGVGGIQQYCLVIWKLFVFIVKQKHDELYFQAQWICFLIQWMIRRFYKDNYIYKLDYKQAERNKSYTRADNSCGK